jgi:putative thiamine transport system permease protein
VTWNFERRALARLLLIDRSAPGRPNGLMTFLRNQTGALPLLLLFALPLAASLGFMLAGVVDAAGWAGLFRHPQFWGGLALSMLTATAATLISAFLSLLIGAAFFERGLAAKAAHGVAAMLAVPHVAFAIGLGFLVMPSGFLARLLAALLGWASPPTWITVHDPYGFALTVALACKETGFLLFNLLAILSRIDVALALRGQRAAAQALGHGMLSIWLRLFLPQLWPNLKWPVAIVFIYAATVVDMALVLGPTQPPVLAVVVWSDINSANVADNARGAAGAVFLALLAAACLALAEIMQRALRPTIHGWMAQGPSLRHFPFGLGLANWRGLQVIFLAVVAGLLLLSLAPLWPFPAAMPEHWNAAAWATAFSHLSPVWLSLGLALATSLSSLAVLTVWFESVAPRWDGPLLFLAMTALAIPALLLGLGQYRLLLRLDLTGTLSGLYFVHLMPVAAYMFILLKAPYRAFDPRYAAVSAGLSQTRLRFLTQIKWPLLKAPLLSSLAIGFAVSFGQYVPAQLAAAGRASTLPMEAVTLSSGANRPLTAVFALLLMLPPLLALLAAGFFGRERWRVA